MNPPDIDRLLAATLADQRLTGGEKTALADALGLADLDDAKRAFVRHRAFALARAESASPDAVTAIDWLEDVVKLLAPAPVAPLAPTADAFFTPGDDCVGAIAGAIRRLKQFADVCVFTITDDRICEPLLDAHRRGVQLRILTDDEKSHELGSDVYRLLSAGVPLRMDRSPYHMHHKFAIFDGLRMINGSYNWTRGAASINFENLVDTADAGLLTRFRAEFERLWSL